MASHRRREIEIFSLSFLDAITCGFGAVILVYVILQSQASRRTETVTRDLRAEVDKIESETLAANRQRVELRNAVQTTEQELAEARGLVRRIVSELESGRVELSTYDAETLARKQSVEKLKSDIQTLEQEARRLSANLPSDEVPGDRVRSRVGDGDRQYLTGLKVGGERVLILIDASASMLDETLVNIIRVRNLDPARQLQAGKWRRAVATLDWLTTQIPRGSRFQVYAFDVAARAAVAGSDGQWLDGSDRRALDQAVETIGRTVPQGGTSLANAFAAARALKPPPDNILLVTDGLPTQGSRPPRSGTVSARQRLELFRAATAELPPGVPVNVILLPMEGDPMAAPAFWQLAIATRGSFLVPSRDWP